MNKIEVYGKQYTYYMHKEKNYEYFRVELRILGEKTKTVQAHNLDELKEKLKEYIPSKKPGITPEAFKIPFSDILKRWYDLNKGVWCDSTAITYKSTINSLNTFYETFMIGNITPEVAQNMVVKMLNNNFQPRAIDRLNNVAKQAMDYAINLGYLKMNPFDGVKIPRVSRIERLPISRKDIGNFVEAAEHSNKRNAMLAMIYSGLRIGECKGLRWHNVNFYEKSITVNSQRTITLDDKGKIKNKLIEKTKNGVSQTIYPPDIFFDVLKDELKRQEYFKSINPKWSNPDGYVFTDVDGKPLTSTSINRAIHEAGKAINRPDITAHFLRHTAGTMVFELTNDLKITQYLLRHSDIRTTMLYVHSSYEDKIEAVRRYDAFINDNKKNDDIKLFDD